MINLLTGLKGSGKTKHLISLAHEAVKNSKGHVVCVEKGNTLTYDVDHAARLINIEDYGIRGYDALYGFICGIAAQDFDLEYIYIDGFKNFIHHTLYELQPFFTSLAKVAEKNNLNIILSISGSETDLPDYIKEMIMEIPN